MKKILFFLFLSLSAFLNANEKSNKLADLLHSFGNNGEYAQMDSVYNLIIHEDHYKQDKLYALNITLDYARFLNQKGDSKRANTLLTQIRENAMALEKFPENTIAHQLQEIAAIALPRMKLPTGNGRTTSCRLQEKRLKRLSINWNR